MWKYILLYRLHGNLEVEKHGGTIYCTLFRTAVKAKYATFFRNLLITIKILFFKLHTVQAFFT